MRVIFSVLSLVIVVAIIGLVAKKQLQATSTLALPSVASAPAGNVAQQSRQIQQQVRDDVNKLMQQRSEQVDEGSK